MYTNTASLRCGRLDSTLVRIATAGASTDRDRLPKAALRRFNDEATLAADLDETARATRDNAARIPE
jgi:hypothetical protein